MRALVLDDADLTLVGNRPQPQPKPGDAVIRPLRIGIGAIDVEVCRGLHEFRGILGREFVGMVESIEGDDERGLLGRRVVGPPQLVCGTCDLCQAGLSEHCRDRTMPGLRGRDGCLAERFVLPAGQLTPVIDAIDDDHAVFALPVARGLQMLRRLTIEGRPYVTVLGDTAEGLIAAQLAGRINASVRVIGHMTEKLELCEKWGIKHRHVDDIGRRADQDIVLDCTGSPQGLTLAMQLVRPRGTIVLATELSGEGWRSAHPELDLTPVITNELTVVGATGGPVAEALDVIARGEVDVLSLISRRMKLNDGPAILQAAARPELIKVLVEV